MNIFISEEVDKLSRDYIENPFGNRKDKRKEGWLEIINALPKPDDIQVDLATQVSVNFPCDDNKKLEEKLLRLLPWRKGPFKVNEIIIDSEWDSRKKWERFLNLNLDLKGKTILDVGSGNGYYAFRMIGEGADKVLCLEPNLMHVSQFAAINNFIGSKIVRMIPERLELLGLESSSFDLIFSMGLLYHQRNPKKHLIELKKLLSGYGKIILETIISPKQYGEALEPEEGRYASMPNVHYVHTDFGCKSLFKQLDMRVVAESQLEITTSEEQRKTKWMPFKSFESALDENNKSLTVEGYPAPKRKFYILEDSGI